MAFNRRWNETGETWASETQTWGSAAGSSEDTASFGLVEQASILARVGGVDAVTFGVEESGGFVVSIDVGASDSLGCGLEEATLAFPSITTSDELALITSDTLSDLFVSTSAEAAISIDLLIESPVLLIEDWPEEPVLPATQWGKATVQSSIWTKADQVSGNPWG